MGKYGFVDDVDNWLCEEGYRVVKTTQIFSAAQQFAIIVVAQRVRNLVQFFTLKKLLYLKFHGK